MGSSIAQSNSLFLYTLLGKEEELKNQMNQNLTSIMTLKRTLQLASHQGDSESIRLLGDMLAADSNISLLRNASKAMILYAISSSKDGNIQSLLNLGFSYQKGNEGELVLDSYFCDLIYLQ